MADGMAARVRERAQAAGGEPAPAERTDGTVATVAPRTIFDEIRGMEGQFQLAMPRGTEAAQLVRDAITAMRMTKHLDECDSASVLGALMTCAQLGLRPGVLGQAWVLPFWDSARDNGPGKGRGGYRAQFVPGYKGLVDLAYRSPLVSSVVGRMVHAGETFAVDYGTADTLVHKPNLMDAGGDVTNYYVLVKMTSGGHVFYTMNRREGELYREKYAPRNKAKEIVGPWVSDFDSMVLKTCLRQLSRWMPKSTEIAQAIDADGTLRVDLTPAALEHPSRPVIEGQVGEPVGAGAGGEA